MTCRRLEFRPRTRAVAGVALLLGLLALLGFAPTGLLGSSRDSLLTLVPVFLLLAVMLLRPYAGERVIARMRAARRDRRRRLPAHRQSRPATPSRLARGGRLIATASAGRGPPAGLAGRR